MDSSLQITVQRLPDDGLKGSQGLLTLHEGDDVILTLHTLERPWLANKTNVSCIPTGTYELKPRAAGTFFARAKERWGHEFGLHITGVPDRSLILAHWGSYIKNTKGCLLVGLAAARSGDENMITGSRLGYRKLYRTLVAEGFGEEIKSIPVVITSSLEGEDDLNDDRDDI